MKIFFARHGESQANILHEISNRGLKNALTQKGCKQAHLLAEKFQEHPLSRIFSSPVLYAIETTVIVSELRPEGLVCPEWNGVHVTA